ncbi:MAG: HAD family hydrolase [Planctomycetes bacterium]|nr:HAD family hydrolase [Planctomycetota bacterium]
MAEMLRPRPTDSPALLFDVMGTLVYDPFAVEVPRALGMSFAEVLAAKHPTSWVEFEYGDLTEAEFLPQFFADGRGYDHAALIATFEQGFRLLDGIEPLLAELNARGLRPQLLSNYPEWWRRIEARTGLSRFADWRFVSCQTRLRKPDAEAFLHAARELERSPGECLFVDDVEKNVAAAARLGMRALRFRDAATLRSELVRLRLLG